VYNVTNKIILNQQKVGINGGVRKININIQM